MLKFPSLTSYDDYTIKNTKGVLGIVDRIETNISLLAFYRSVDLGLSKYNLVGGVMDEYQDETGIDKTSSSGQDYNYSLSCYKPIEKSGLDSYTKCLIHFNNGSTPSNAIFFDGTGDYITVPDGSYLDFGTGDFTVEWRANHLNISSGATRYFSFGAYGSQGLACDLNGTSTMELRLNGNLKTWSWTPVAGIWYHMAFTRKGSNVDFWVNGQKQGSTATDSSNITGNSTAFFFGVWADASNYPFNGHMRELRVSNCARYIADFTPQASPFVNDAYTGLLIHGTDTNGSTTFTDSSGKTVTQYGSFYLVNGLTTFFDTATGKIVSKNGNVALSGYKFNKSAGFFNGTTDYVVVPDSDDWDFSGAFTIEGFFNFTNVDAYSSFFGYQTSGQYAFFHHIDNKIEWQFPSSNHRWAFDPSPNTWYFIQFIRQANGDLSINVNGSPLSLTNGTGNYNSAVSHSGNFLIGNYNSGNYFNGWMKELRISNVARTVAVPTTQYTSDANTKLLMHFDTPATAPLAPAIYFDGTGDYLSVPDSDDWDMTDFTFEFFYNTSSVKNMYVINDSIDATKFVRIEVDTATGPRLSITVMNSAQIFNTAISLNKWNHVAIVRSGSTVTPYHNGIPLGTMSVGTALTSNGIRISGNQGGADLFTGYLKEIRISSVARYTSAFTPSQTGFIVDSHTKLYIKGDENNGATSFIDSSTSPKTVTTYGDTKIKYTEDYRSCIFKDETGKFPYSNGSAKVDFVTAMGTGCGYFDGTNSFLSLADSDDWYLATDDFTIELYAWINSHNSINGFVAQNQNGTNYWSFETENTGTYMFFLWNNNGSATSLNVNLESTITTKTWHHFVVTRSGSNFRFFIDGTQQGSAQVSSTTINNFSGSLWIGRSGAYDTNYLNGRIDSVRVSKGIARYTSAFNPPSTTPTFDSYDKLYIPMDSTARVANETIGFFDGASSYLTYADSSDYDFGTGDFTIDFWLHRRDYSFGTGEFLLATTYYSSGVWDGGYYICIQTNNYMQFVSYSGNSVQTNEVWTGSVISTGAWHHVAFVKTGGYLTCYLDGVSLGSRANSYSINTSTTSHVLSVGAIDVGGYTAFYNGLLDNFRISKGIARWTTNFTPPTSAVADAYTKLLLNFEGSNLTQCAVDSSGIGKTVTTYGDAVTTPTSDCFGMVMDDSEITPKVFTPVGNILQIPYKFNRTALWLNGTDSSASYVAVPDSDDWAFGTGDFTIECWWMILKWPVSTGYSDICSQRTDGSYGWHFSFIYNTTPSSKAFHFRQFNPSTAPNLSFTNKAVEALQLRTWYHVAISRSGNSWRFFLDGVQVGSTQTDSTSIANFTGTLNIGGNSINVTSYHKGWIKEFRISNTARYTSNFTPSTTQFANDAYTKLLLHFDSPAKIPVSNAAYFDGTGDVLSLASSSDWEFGAGDYTLECVVMFSTVGTVHFIHGNAQKFGLSYYSNTLRYQKSDGTYITGAWTPYPNKWYHLACTRASGSVRLFVDGVQVGSTTTDATTVSGVTAVYVGAYDASNYLLNGWMKEVRISNTARYTANFTPPVNPFRTDTYTKLLLHFNETCGTKIFFDDCVVPKTVTTVGDTIIIPVDDWRNQIIVDSSSHARTGIRCYGNTSGFGKAKIDFVSVYEQAALYPQFDDTTWRLQTPQSSDYDFGTNQPFRIECWVRMIYNCGDTTVGGWGAIASKYLSPSQGWIFWMDFRDGYKKMSFYDYPNSGTVNINCLNNFISEAWYHLTAMNYNNYLYLFVNGRRQGVGASSTLNFNGGNFPMVIGNYNNGSWGGQNLRVIAMDEFRIEKGASKGYNSSFNMSEYEYALPTVSPLSLQSITFAPVTPADYIRISVFEEDLYQEDKPVLNTDLMAYVTRDGGINWKQITLTDQGYYSGYKRILSGIADMTSLPSGSSVAYKIVSANSKVMAVHACGLNW